MIKLDFEVIQLKKYEQYLIGYQGLDLSYLGITSKKYLNKWAMPCVSRNVEDREITLRYAVPDRITAKQLANDAMLTSNIGMISSKIHEERSARYTCNGVSWNEFSNRIEVTVKLMMESGFLQKETSADRQNVFLLHEEGNGTSMDWGIDLNPSETADRPITILWDMGGWTGDTVAHFEMNIPHNNGAAIHFDTRNLEKSTIGNDPLVKAIKSGYVTFSGPLIPDALDNEHAIGLKFNIKSDLNFTVNWIFWKRYLLP